VHESSIKSYAKIGHRCPIFVYILKTSLILYIQCIHVINICIERRAFYTRLTFFYTNTLFLTKALIGKHNILYLMRYKVTFMLPNTPFN